MNRKKTPEDCGWRGDHLTESGGPPPWFDMQVYHRMQWRDSDVVISVPVKSGTTWTMNIVHQLRCGGDRDFEDIYVEVPWPEVLDRPGRSTDELVERLDSMPTDRRRAFKTHSPPPDIPYFDPSEKDVRYIVVVRNPEEAVASLRPFLESRSPEWLQLWSLPVDLFEFSDFQTFYDRMIVKGQMASGIFDFVAKWWPLRKKENVLFLHYSEMKKDHEASVRKIADFLGYEPTDEEWDTIVECSGFPWMKKHEHKFELRKSSAVAPLKPGGMVRKGEINRSHEDGITEEISKDLATRGRQILKDEDAFAWLYHGAWIGSGDGHDEPDGRHSYKKLESYREWL